MTLVKATATFKTSTTTSSASTELELVQPPKVQVSFRPHSAYKGEFGFDWIRMGDTKRDGDKDWYANIMGKYYTDAAFTIPNTDINDSTASSHWKKDLGMYDSWLKSFKRKINIDWKKKAGNKDFLYAVPMITLMPNDNEAKLDVHVTIKEKPKKIEIKPKEKNTGVQFNTTSLAVKEGVQNNALSVKCTKALTKDLIVDVLADGIVCGQFIILQNDASTIKDINVVLVNVESDINGYAKDKTGTPTTGGKIMLDNALKQALVNGKVKAMTKTLNVKGTYVPLVNIEISNAFRDKFATKRGTTYTIDKNSGSLLQYLNDEFDKQFASYLASNTVDYRVYFIGETGAWNGFAQKTQRAGLYFPTHNATTIPHELMHAMGLAHTFVNSDADAAAKFTYKIGQTVNIMDYSHQTRFGRKDRNSLFYWQWKLLNSKMK